MQVRNYHIRVRGIVAILIGIRSYMIMLQASRARLRRLPFNDQRKIAGCYVEQLRRRQFCKLFMCQRWICRGSKQIVLELAESGARRQNFNSGFVHEETSSGET